MFAHTLYLSQMMTMVSAGAISLAPRAHFPYLRNLYHPKVYPHFPRLTQTAAPLRRYPLRGSPACNAAAPGSLSQASPRQASARRSTRCTTPSPPYPTTPRPRVLLPPRALLHPPVRCRLPHLHTRPRLALDCLQGRMHTRLRAPRRIRHRHLHQTSPSLPLLHLRRTRRSLHLHAARRVSERSRL